MEAFVWLQYRIYTREKFRIPGHSQILDMECDTNGYRMIHHPALIFLQTVTYHGENT